MTERENLCSDNIITEQKKSVAKQQKWSKKQKKQRFG